MRRLEHKLAAQVSRTETLEETVDTLRRQLSAVMQWQHQTVQAQKRASGQQGAGGLHSSGGDGQTTLPRKASVEETEERVAEHAQESRRRALQQQRSSVVVDSGAGNDGGGSEPSVASTSMASVLSPPASMAVSGSLTELVSDGIGSSKASTGAPDSGLSSGRITNTSPTRAPRESEGSEGDSQSCRDRPALSFSQEV